MVTNTTYTKENNPANVTMMSNMPYQEAIGSLMYTAVAT